MRYLLIPTSMQLTPTIRRRDCEGKDSQEPHTRRNECVFEGLREQEALCLIKFLDGQKNFFEGIRNKEVGRRVEFLDGQKIFYEGSGFLNLALR
jgi:hypothetical protein